MGSRETNFYVDLACRFGFEEVALEVQSLYLDGKRDEAYEAIPDELVDATSLDRHRGRGAPSGSSAFADVGIDRLIAAPVQLDRGERIHTLERLAAIVTGKRVGRMPALSPGTVFPGDRSAAPERRGLRVSPSASSAWLPEPSAGSGFGFRCRPP